MQLEELGLSRTLKSLAEIPPFVSTKVHLSDVHKTGLGSSAALITSLTSALLVHLDVISDKSLSEDDNDGRRLAHNLAQYVHCQAQGKVGSGFDVSAAVFGSHLYTRFDPSVISDLMNESNVSNSCLRLYYVYSTSIFLELKRCPPFSPLFWIVTVGKEAAARSLCVEPSMGLPN